MAKSFRDRMKAAVVEGLRGPGKGTTAASAESERSDLNALGIYAPSFGMTDDELAEWSDRIWKEQDDILDERQKEATQVEKYVANEQYISYHRGRREWLTRRAVPYRIRSVYNICGKALETRVRRLTENKPTVSVQAATVSQDDVQKSEYKQTLFWGLWEKLSLHRKIVGVRTLASMHGSGFLKGGWDPDAGTEIPRTRKQPKYNTVDTPVTDPTTGQPAVDPATNQPVTQPSQQYAGIEEVYLDAQGNPLGPVEGMVDDEDNPGQQKKVRFPVPDGCEVFNEGEVFVDERAVSNVRWDRYVDEPHESWYIQDAAILPGLSVVAMFPKSISAIQQATPASEDEKLQLGKALEYRDPIGTTVSRDSRTTESTAPNELDREYVVRETWIFPKNPLIKKLWGQNGAKLVTVGGQLVEKSELPEWARRKCNFIRFVDIPERGNHYCKSFMRDVLPIQDDINRSRSMLAEGSAMRNRLILAAPKQHGIDVRELGGKPGVLMTVRTKDHIPEVLDFGREDSGTSEFYRSSLEAAADLGNMNDASSGKLPSAGLAAKAIYALQYADEAHISKTSTLQDESLKELAMLLDAITRIEYKEKRKVRLTGEDRDFLVEEEILPEHLETDVDYFFTPGSMLSKQKEAVKNEVIELMHEGLVDENEARKYLSSAVPDMFRRSNDQHEAKARRNLNKILRRNLPVQPEPWNNPDVHVSVYEEYMNSQKWDVTDDTHKRLIIQLWQAFRLQIQARMQAQAAQAQPPQPPGKQPPRGKLGKRQQPTPNGGAAVPTAAQGAEMLAQKAEAAVAPPGGQQ